MRLLLLLFLPLIMTGAEPVPAKNMAFLDKFCIDCHDEDMNEGNLNLDFKNIDWTSAESRKHWTAVYTMLERGKMPPKKKKQPSTAERLEMMKWVDQKLVANSPIGGTPMRRLNKREYLQSLRNIFSLYKHELPQGFPVDNESHGFDTMGEALVISPSHMEAYAESAVKIADYLLPPSQGEVKPRSWLINPQDMTISYSSAYIVDNAMRLASSGIKTRNASWPTKFEAPHSGTYKVALLLSTKNPPKGNQPEFVLSAHTSGGKSKDRVLGKFKIKSGKPQVFQTEVTLYKGENLLFAYSNSPYDYSKGKAKQLKEFLIKEFTAKPRLAAAWAKVKNPPRGGNGWARVKKAMADPKLNIAKYKKGSKEIEKVADAVVKKGVNSGETLVYHYFEEGPNIGIHKVSVKGPFKLIEDASQKAQKEATNKFLNGLNSKSSDAEISTFLNKYLSKVFRRPAKSSEVKAYLSLIRKEMDAGRAFKDGMHLAVRTSLITPSFLYRERGKGALDDYELASRLAYFLTSSPPDFPLLSKVKEGNLSQKGALKSQTERLLKSNHLSKFVADFTSQWLDSNLLDTIMPDPKLFRRFGDSQRAAMKAEIELTFKEILLQNKPLTDFIDPDFIYTDPTINKEIYKLSGKPKGGSGKVKRYTIKRGGENRRNSQYARSYDGNSKWRGHTASSSRCMVIGKCTWNSASGPPKAVPALPPDITGAKSPKEMLAAHMGTASCASCHEDIDPLGFVLESFDAVGKWRTVYPGNKKKKVPVDTTGVMPDGTQLKDVRDLKKYLTENPILFTTCIAEKLMAYATGRPMNYREHKILKEIAKKNIQNGNRFKDLLLELVESDIFKAR